MGNVKISFQGPDTTSTIPTGTSTSTTPHGTVYDSTTHTGSTTSIITPHGTYFTSTIHTGTSASTTQHETVVTSTSPNGTNTSSTEHSTIPISEALVDATGSIYNTKDSIIKNQDGITSFFLCFFLFHFLFLLNQILCDSKIYSFTQVTQP